jgi:hypothetical protein
VLTRYVTLSLGDRHDLTARAHIALLNAMAWAPAPAEFWLVTDRPDLFGFFGDRLRIQVVDAATLAAWKGRHGFFWRIELMTALTIARLGGGHTVYFDSDVLMRLPLDDLVAALSTGDVLMHEREYDLAIARRRGQRDLWRQVAGRQAAGLTVAAPCPMWNAGLIAVGDGNQPVLERALAVLDGLMDAGVAHNLVEQLAISLSLAATGRLREGRGWMDHFWCNKDGYGESIDRQLAEILYRRLPVESAVAHCKANPIVRPLIVRRRWWNRLFLGLAGMRR